MSRTKSETKKRIRISFRFWEETREIAIIRETYTPGLTNKMEYLDKRGIWRNTILGAGTFKLGQVTGQLPGEDVADE